MMGGAKGQYECASTFIREDYSEDLRKVTPPILPVTGTLPPTVNDSQGNPQEFWSITVYQPDTSQSGGPFISQASVLNTPYTSANIP
jgi:hypothetical protein